jgi:hypothetical protein
MYEPTELVRPLCPVGEVREEPVPPRLQPDGDGRKLQPRRQLPTGPFLVRDVLTGRLGRIVEETWKPKVAWEAPTLSIQRSGPELVDWSRLEPVEPAAAEAWRTRFDLVVLLALTALNGALAWLTFSP